MLNITLTLTAAPELIAAITNIANALKYQNIEGLQKVGCESVSSKIEAEHKFQQVANAQNAHRQNFETATVPIASQAVKTEQYVQTVLPIDMPVAAINQGGVSTIQPQNQKQAEVFQSNAQVVPTTVQSYTMEQLAVAATQIVDAGHRTELVSLLSSFGVQALTALPKEQYGAFATQLRVLGAKI
ncbi:MAG: hypothetical protein Q8936_12965 [Bacillota bacterium]|nr:hypothetical protein [Bacillota bacterium]